MYIQELSGHKSSKTKGISIENDIIFSMKKVLILVVAFLITAAFILGSIFVFVTTNDKRETFRDMKVNIEDEIVMDLPAVPPYCDELDLDARYVNIGDCNLYIEEEGEGVPMVILHGGPGSTHHNFHPHFLRAKNFAKVIYYDQRGCGFSDYEPGEGGYSVEQAVNDLEKLRQALGIEKWIVLGHSYGGYLAQRYAIEYPESVMGLILVTAVPGLRDTVGLEGVVHKLEPTRQYDYISEEEMKRMKEIRAEISNLVKEEKIPPEKAVEIWLYNNQLNGDWKRQNFYRPTEEEMTRSALYGWKHDGVFNEVFLGRPGFNWIMSMDAGKVDLEGAFEDCPMPTLIIEADWDLTWNTDKPQKMQENHPGSEMVVFQSSGHSPFADDPEKFFNLLEEFVTTLPEISQKDVLKWKGYLGRWEEEKKKDPILFSPVGEEEKKAIEDFDRVREEIKRGGKFEDCSTPLNSFLALISNLHFKDVEGVKAQYVVDPEASGMKLSGEVLEGWESELSAMDILRAPPPPKNEEGEIWPLYLGRNSELSDVYVFVFLGEEWKVLGNLEGLRMIMGYEVNDWRFFITLIGY